MIADLLHELRSLDTGTRQLRSFGRTVGTAFLLLALVVLWYRDWVPGPSVYGLGGVGGLLLLLGLTVPALLRPVYRVWMGLALVLGYVMTRVLLTTVFWLVVTPIGLLRRALGKDPLTRTLDPVAPTYWIPKAYPDRSPQRLERYY